MDKTNNHAFLLKANGEKVEVTPKNGTDFKCEELQKYVGGYFEFIPLDENRDKLLALDEDGKLKRKPLNESATALMILAGYNDCAVGDVLLLPSSMVK